MARQQNSHGQGFLRVPLHLQALCLDAEQDVVRALADYRLLPSETRGVARNPRTPNLSEHLLTPPFTRDLPLPAGLHLHWLLPDALTQGEQDEALTRFPHVPNRWLILRGGGGKPEQQWVVESDYLHPEGAEFDSEGATPINLQAVPDPSPGPGQRFRFVGRALTLDAWRAAQGTPGREYLDVLTSVGPEAEVSALDPVRATFASFYPNCRTVFGFHDPDFVTRVPPAGLRYDVIGWYGDATRDCLAPLLSDADSPERLRELLEERLEWELEAPDARPAATLFHARLSFTPGSRASRDRVRDLPLPTLAVGRTETEALAAHLAHRYSEQTQGDAFAVRQVAEEQLEALQLTERLDGHRLDLEDILRETRHERGFASRASGIRWSVQPLTDTSEDFFARFRKAPARKQRREPPSASAGLLDTLNSLQEEYQRATDALEDLRQRMYVRWHALMPSKGVNINFFEGYVVPVRRHLTSMGRLRLEQEAGTGAFRAVALPSAFEVVSSRHTLHATYLRVINTGNPFNVDNKKHESYETWGIEFQNCCGFDLQPSHTVTVVERDQAWDIVDRGITYPVRARATGLFLEIPPAETSLAVRLSHALDAVQDAVRAHNATEEGLAAPYAVRAVPEAPWWEPSDPVVLFTGEAAEGGIWRDVATKPDLLPCDFADLSLDLTALPAATLTALGGYLGGLDAEHGDVWKEQPWNPFLMHWSAQVAPCGRDDNLDFDAGLLLEHYQLGLQDVDPTLKPGEEADFSTTNDTYSGISLLSPSAGLEVRERILRWLENVLLPDYYVANDVPGEAQVEGYLEAHFAQVREWYVREHGQGGIEDPLLTALWSYEELEKTPCLAQSLGNFNQVLMLREPTLQLAIGDPTALPSSLHFFITETTRDAMGDSLQRRPLLLDRFNPLRAGALSLTGLWLVDTFGQVKEVMALDTPANVKVITTTDQTPASSAHQVLLSPRLAQPARVRFEWLPAESSGGRRTNEHPETNPVCGFLLVNNLDGALAVYDAKGRALGAVDRGRTWRTAPETGVAVRMDARGLPQLPNPHLQRVVHHVLAQDETFLKYFLSTQRTALDGIDPEAYAENPSRALLVARPVAVVRASLSIELQGPPAFDPSALARGTLTSRGLEHLRIPLRLGEHQQLDDGLVGFWKETPEGDYEDGVFYSPQLRGGGHEKITTYAKDAKNTDAMYLTPTPVEPARAFTLLLDPRGQVHATTGLLPSPQLRLHPDHYGRALAEMEVSFLTAPFLTDRGALRLPVPDEPGHTWSWVTQEPGGAWVETKKLAPPNPRAAFSAPQELREGWLILRRTRDSDT